ncbi:proteasome activator complex subunit 4-like protein, partial [Leptotrombidium deliense]
ETFFEFNVFSVSNECIVNAQKLWKVGALLGCTERREAEINAAMKKHKNRCSNNVIEYEDFIEKIAELIEGNKMHWKYNEIAFKLLTALIRIDYPYPKVAIKLFLRNLNNDIIVIRKICINAVGRILKQQKRKHPKKKVDHFDNHLLQFKLNVDYLDENVYNSTIFVEKKFWCFYKWPQSELFVYEDSSKQPKVNRNVDELPEEEKIVFEYFTDNALVTKLIDLLPLEENEESDNFNGELFSLFKRLSCNFSLNVFEKITPKILHLVSSTNKSKQICASEIIIGLIRGSKHWPLIDLKNIRDLLTPIIQEMFRKITQETCFNWGIFFGLCFMDRDGRKLCWIINLVLDNLRGTDVQVFYDATSIDFLTLILMSCDWRILMFCDHLISILESRLSDHFHEIRKKVAMLLKYIFQYEVKAFDNNLKQSLTSAEFMKRVLPQLLEYNNDNQTESDRVSCLNKMKTVCLWLHFMHLPSHPINSHYFHVLPFLCDIQKDTKDNDAAVYAYLVLTDLAQAIMTESSVAIALTACNEVIYSKFYKSRETLAQFLKLMVNSNFFRLNGHLNTIVEIVFKLLEDENIIVRNSLMATFSACIEKRIIIPNNDVINELIQKTKVTTDKELVQRHAGFVGLCAIVNAFPFDVPYFIPSILVYLSAHLNAAEPIRVTIEETLRDFRRTHSNNWGEHKLKFNTDQLQQLNNVLTSLNYYS